MDEEQLERFGEAVKRKSEEAKAASEQTKENPTEGSPAVAGDQENLYATGRPQDTFSIRDKNAGKGKKTADKWNQ